MRTCYPIRICSAEKKRHVEARTGEAPPPKMIYVLAGSLLIALWHYVRVGRRSGALAVLRELALTLAAGLIAGVLVAIGARLGMRLIAEANDAAPRISLTGTSVVFVVYCGIGALCAVLYSAVFRWWLRRSGLRYGCLLFLVTWYPLAHSGAQQLVEPLSFLSLALWSAAIIALMWLPYAIALERLLSWWDRRQTGHLAPR
jgi:hypothetical protein